MASTYPSTQWGEIIRGRLPLQAASDIVAGAPVRIASTGDWAVQMCQSSAEKPIGVAENSPTAGQAVTVFDDGNILRRYPLGLGAGASYSRQAFVGVIGTSAVTHPQSAVSVTTPVLGQVTATPSIAVGASTTAVWALGTSFESTAAGDKGAYRIEPRLLSGLLSS